MKDNPTLWQRCLSFLFEIKLETSCSDINEYLEVALNAGQIQLGTASAVYSHEKKYHNFSKLFEQLDFSKLSGQRVLLLGLGLGSVIQLLDESLDGKQFTAVELDEEIVRLAEKYILHKINTPVEVVTTDAYTFVEQCQEKFDLICMDVFIDDYIPEQFCTEEFCKLLNEVLHSYGTLVYNCPAFNKESQQSSTAFFTGPFRKIFPEGKYIHTHKNYMLLNNSKLVRR